MGIKETLGRVIRIETEPRELVLTRHLSQMDRIEAEEIAIRKKLRQSTTSETIRELHEVMSKRIEAMVGRLKGRREIVIFNGHRIPLPSVVYP